MANTLSTPRIDLAATPFSRRGCWLAVSYPPAHYQVAGPGLYLRSLHARPIIQRELFRLDLLRGGEVIEHTAAATPGLLTLKPGGNGSAGNDDAEVRIALEAPATVRIHGRGVGLRLTAAIREKSLWPTVAYHEGPGRLAVNFRGALRRYEIIALEGPPPRLEGDWEGEHFTRASVGIEAPAWELAIDEFLSTWVDRRREPLDEVARSAAASCEQLTGGLPRVPAEFEATRALAGYLLWSATMSPCGRLGREATFMSLNWMDGVWSWDNVFNAVALAGADAKLAFDQMMVVADHQDEHGAYPDYIGDAFKHYNFSKPPVQGVLMDELARHRPRWFTPARRRALVDSIERFTRWWLEHRRYPGRRLCHYLHGNDSGWDNSTILHKGSPLIAPDLNAFLARQCQWLSRQHEKLGAAAKAKRWAKQADQLTADLLDELWNGEQFIGIKLPEDEPVACSSLVDCMPVLLGERLPGDIRAKLASRIETFITDHGIATEHPHSALYTPDGYWRGPIWGPSTMLIVLGLESIGQDALARSIAQRYCRTCRRSGFAENFDALSGAALRDPGYTWTASAFLMLAGRLKAAGA